MSKIKERRSAESKMGAESCTLPMPERACLDA